MRPTAQTTESTRKKACRQRSSSTDISVWIYYAVMAQRELVVLRSYRNRIPAELDKGTLEAAGLSSFLDVGPYGPGARDLRASISSSELRTPSEHSKSWGQNFSTDGQATTTA